MDEFDLDPEFIPAKRIEVSPRDERGLFIPYSKPAPTEDERLSSEEVILGLRNLWFHGRKGSRRALAIATGFKDRRQLSTLLRGKAPLYEPIRRRCSRFLTRVKRGELELVQTGYANTGCPMYTWRTGGIARSAIFRWDARSLKARDRRALDDWT